MSDPAAPTVSPLVRAVPRGTDAEVAEDSPADAGATGEDERSVLRERVPPAGAASAPTMRKVRESTLGETSPGLLATADGGVAVPPVPPRTSPGARAAAHASARGSPEDPIGCSGMASGGPTRGVTFGAPAARSAASVVPRTTLAIARPPTRSCGTAGRAYIAPSSATLPALRVPSCKPFPASYPRRAASTGFTIAFAVSSGCSTAPCTRLLAISAPAPTSRDGNERLFSRSTPARPVPGASAVVAVTSRGARTGPTFGRRSGGCASLERRGCWSAGNGLPSAPKIVRSPPAVFLGAAGFGWAACHAASSGSSNGCALGAGTLDCARCHAALSGSSSTCGRTAVATAYGFPLPASYRFV